MPRHEIVPGTGTQAEDRKELEDARQAKLKRQKSGIVLLVLAYLVFK